MAGVGGGAGGAGGAGERLRLRGDGDVQDVGDVFLNFSHLCVDADIAW